ncbi:amino acid adenylation domain-containing protein [Ectothiorhodospiraceae bacterium BW-2]|nr:amino acid adenylation domain-containing protein [Ectothiorhodospiraceae bacterium BW-2]
MNPKTIVKKPIIQRIKEQALAHPAAIAIYHHQARLRYDELEQQSNQLARHLLMLGIQKEQRIGLCAPRCISLLVGVLGILKAGAVYVPLDPSYPRKRLAYMLQDSQLDYLLLTEATESLVAALVAEEPQPQPINLERDWDLIATQTTQPLATSPTPDQLAYCLYTSGSTGVPKAVLMAHDSLNNLIHWHLTHRITPARQLQFAPLSFDISFQEIFATWCSGGSLFLIDEHTRRNPLALLDFICAQGIEKLYFPFTPLQQLAIVAQDTGQYPTQLREVITAGEQLQITPAIRDLFLRSGASLHHHYGATECQDVTALDLSGDPQLWPTLPSIGCAIDNIQTHILDDNLAPVAAGDIGELYIGGVGLARGYLNRAELNAEKFIIHPTKGRLYKTCDMAREQPDGHIELLGRRDQAVKIRGFRVELGEVEAALLQHEDISQAAVIVHEDEEQHKRLLAYLVLHTSRPLSQQQLQTYLAQTLPAYMVPARFITLDEMPMSPSGKVDRAALPAAAKQPLPAILARQVQLARTPLEQQLADIWQKLLHIEPIDIYDDFFALGGDSLLLIKLFSELKKQLSINVPLANLLQKLNIAELAKTLEERTPTTNTMALSVTELQAQAVCPLQTPVVAAAASHLVRPQTILLTGATGFLGAFLLHELLHQTEADIYCLVRSENRTEAQQRLLTTQRRYGLVISTELEQRLHPLCGDLARPYFGLTEMRWEELTELIDCVYHAAANINMLYPYSVLHPINVKGTQEIIHFAVQSRVKPIHYISSTAIFESQGFFKPSSAIAEDIDLQHCESVYGGYAQSKWVAEKMLQQAQAQGLPVTIYRLGMLTGDSRTGVANTDDMMCKLLKLFVLQQSIPALSTPLDMTPVDYASQAIVYLSQSQRVGSQCFHIINQKSLSFNQLTEAFNSLGYPVQSIHYSHWLNQLRTLAIDSKDNALGAMLPIFTDDIAGKSYLELSSLSLALRDDNTRRGLQHSRISCPEITVELLATYLDYFVTCGFLTRPNELR